MSIDHVKKIIIVTKFSVFNNYILTLIWLGESLLNVIFPRLYNTETNKNIRTLGDGGIEVGYGSWIEVLFFGAGEGLIPMKHTGDKIHETQSRRCFVQLIFGTT